MILVAEQVIAIILIQWHIRRIVVVRSDQVVVACSASIKVWIVVLLSPVVVWIAEREVVKVVAISAMTAAVTTTMVIVVVTSMVIIVVIIVSSRPLVDFVIFRFHLLRLGLSSDSSNRQQHD